MQLLPQRHCRGRLITRLHLIPAVERGLLDGVVAQEKAYAGTPKITVPLMLLRRLQMES